MICAATATTDSFLPGTAVALHSFRKRHPDFRGDFVAIHNGLADDTMLALSACCPSLKYVQVSPELNRSVNAIVDARPDLAHIRARFHSLDVFRLRGYERVVFFDSDVLFLKPIDEFLRGEFGGGKGAFAACGDGAYYEGRALRIGNRDLTRTFNAGLLSIGADLLNDQVYGELLGLASPPTFRDPNVVMTDQAVLNLYFAQPGCPVPVSLAGPEFNYLMLFRRAIEASRQLKLESARMVHFNGPVKPWDPAAVLRGGAGDPIFASACALWLQNFAACLPRVGLAGARREPVPTRSEAGL